jgi:hypothetical protein
MAKTEPQTSKLYELSDGDLEFAVSGDCEVELIRKIMARCMKDDKGFLKEDSFADAMAIELETEIEADVFSPEWHDTWHHTYMWARALAENINCVAGEFQPWREDYNDGETYADD